MITIGERFLFALYKMEKITWRKIYAHQNYSSIPFPTNKKICTRRIITTGPLEIPAFKREERIIAMGLISGIHPDDEKRIRQKHED